MEREIRVRQEGHRSDARDLKRENENERRVERNFSLSNPIRARMLSSRGFFHIPIDNSLCLRPSRMSLKAINLDLTFYDFQRRLRMHSKVRDKQPGRARRAEVAEKRKNFQEFQAPSKSFSLHFAFASLRDRTPNRGFENIDSRSANTTDPTSRKP